MLYKNEKAYLLSTIADLLRFRLLECTGGALALRCTSEHILLTTFGSSFRRWALTMEDFIVVDNDGGIVEKHEHYGAAGTGLILEIFRSFPRCNAVLHSHAECCLAFAALRKTLPHATSLTQTLGEIPCLGVDETKLKNEYRQNPFEIKIPPGMVQRPELAALNEALFSQLHEKFDHRKDELERHGLAFTLYQHGVTVFAKNMDEAFNNLARMEACARTYIYGRMILSDEGTQT